jgi:hypothetical protein
MAGRSACRSCRGTRSISGAPAPITLPAALGRVELPHYVTVQRPHDADARHHGRTGVFDDQEHRFDRGLPLRELLFGLRKHLDISGGVLEGDELPAARQRDRIIELAFPTPAANGANPSCRIRSSSHPAAGALRPFRTRYTSDRARPAPPQVQACSPSHGRSGWLSHTQPQSSQTEHFMACQAYQDFCNESSLRPIRPCLGSIQRFGEARRVSSGNRASGRFFPAKIRAHIGAFLAANLACSGSSDVIRPSVAADCCPMAALAVRLLDQRRASQVDP